MTGTDMPPVPDQKPKQRPGDETDGLVFRKDATAGNTPPPQPDTTTYKVGYGKPPKSTQFTKGKSGNPLGRPRKFPPKKMRFEDGVTEDILEEELYRPIKVMEDGKQVEMPAIRAVIRSVVLNGAKGNRIAQQNLLSLVQSKEEHHGKRKRKHYFEFRRMKEEHAQILADCARRGVEPPELYPHPDDIELNEYTYGVTIHGPITKAHAQFLNYLARNRDYLVLKAVKQERAAMRKPAERNEALRDLWLVQAKQMNRHVKRRYAWKDGEPQKLIEDLLMLSDKAFAHREAEEEGWLQQNEINFGPDVTYDMLRKTGKEAMAEFKRIREFTGSARELASPNNKPRTKSAAT